ncbi:RNA polymerase sigma factor [Paucisalibacillus sp. EB02]|uniref:RNA polymerase sigma factor n=1 Tax=Paucisalibacillus sp. EB02 TaxID=1347087 RepID=UPI0004B9F47F|nr:RNA polymerase sigma factor [Paucisalibacillus sp. EB02]
MENLNQIGDELRKIEREFKKKIEPHRSDLWRYCYRLTGSPWDTEDLVQETLLKSLSVLAKLFQPVETKAYLFRIATNQWIDHIRKNRITQLPLKEFVLQENSSEFDYMLYENLEILVQQLTPMQYVALILSDGFGFKAQDVARIIGSSEGAIYTGLSRARSVLKNNRKKISLPNSIHPIEANKAMDRLIAGFRNKDPMLIASMLDDNITVDIIHSGVELGVNEAKRNSLKDWKEIVDKQHLLEVMYIELWGKPVIIEMERKSDNYLYLNNVHYMELHQDKVIHWKFYCFSYDFMKLVAATLDVRLNAANFYHIF